MALIHTAANIPLNTIFTPPASCSTSSLTVGADYQVTASANAGSDCYPSGYKFGSPFLASSTNPICPAGYIFGCPTTIGPSVSGFCCPSDIPCTSCIEAAVCQCQSNLVYTATTDLYVFTGWVATADASDIYATSGTPTYMTSTLAPLKDHFLYIEATPILLAWAAPPSSKLSAGAIVGIVVGVLAVCLGLGALAFHIYRRRKRAKAAISQVRDTDDRKADLSELMSVSALDKAGDNGLQKEKENLGPVELYQSPPDVQPVPSAAELEINESVARTGELGNATFSPAVVELDDTRATPQVVELGTARPIPQAFELGTTQPLPQAVELETTQPLPQAAELDTAHPAPRAVELTTTQLTPSVVEPEPKPSISRTAAGNPGDQVKPSSSNAAHEDL